MYKLLFPVKLGPLLGVVLAACCGVGCGYRTLYGGAAPAEKLSVVAATNRVAHIGVGEAVLHGLRSQLSVAGALRAGSGWPRVVVEVLRVDESTRAVSVRASENGDIPLGRGVAIAVVARAWVEPAATAPRQRDTGDVRRVVVVATPATDQVTLTYARAAETAAWAVGRALGKRVLGDPVPSDEPL